MPIRTLFVFCATLILSSACFAETIIKSHAISTHGEPKYSKNFTHFEYVNPDAPQGGTLRVAEIGTFDSLNPFSLKGRAELNTLLLMQDHLMESSLDEPSVHYGLIAQSVEYTDSREWIIFHLNPKARFSDGTPITAEDVVFSFDILMKDGGPRYKLYWADIEKAEALSKHSVKFHNKNPGNTELFTILGQVPVLPKHYWASRDITKSTLEIPVSSGPYTVKSVDPGRKIIYQKVKDYWAQDIPSRKGMFNYEHIEATYYKDPDVRLEAFKAGEFDIQFEGTAKNWATAYNIPAVKSGKIIKVEIPDQNSKGMNGLIFNLRKEKLQSPALRQAINYAFDFEWTNKNIFYNAYSRTDSFFENSPMASQGTPSAEELSILNKYKKNIPEDVFSKAYIQPTTDGSGNNRKNLKTAKAILTSAGYKISNGKLIDPKTKQPVTLEIIESSSVYEGLINPWIANLKKLGIDANFRVVDASQYISRVKSFDYEATILGIPQSLSPGNEQRYYWGSNTIDQEGSRNYMGISNPAIDAIIELVINAKTHQEQITATRALDRILLHSHFAVPLHHSDKFRVAYWNKFSRPEIPPKYDYQFIYGPYFWWHDTKKAADLKK